jgi:hypothetical protein
METTQTQGKQGRGGARAGAGRKKYAPERRKKTLGIRLSPAVFAFISTKPNKSRAIEQIIRQWCELTNIPID